MVPFLHFPFKVRLLPPPWLYTRPRFALFRYPSDSSSIPSLTASSGLDWLGDCITFVSPHFSRRQFFRRLLLTVSSKHPSDPSYALRVAFMPLLSPFFPEALIWTSPRTSTLHLSPISSPTPHPTAAFSPLFTTVFSVIPSPLPQTCKALFLFEVRSLFRDGSSLPTLFQPWKAVVHCLCLTFCARTAIS